MSTRRRWSESHFFRIGLGFVIYKIKFRILPLIVIAFGIGLYLGIEATATGTFKLPLGVMQKQLHEVRDIPLKNVLHPQDKED